MMDHMLRRKIGDDAFRQGLVGLYRDFRGKRAGFADLQHEFEAASQTDLGPFFQQWVQRTGAPSLGLEQVKVTQSADGLSVDGVLVQTQSEPPYQLEVPVTVLTSDGPVTVLVLTSEMRRAFSIPVTGTPISLSVDPMFDLFRLLDPRETPASIGQIFGDERIVAVLPAAATESKRNAYRQLMEAWRSDNHAIDIVDDRQLQQLPVDRSVWILGRENRFADAVMADEHLSLGNAGDEAIQLEGKRVAFADHCLVVVRRHQQNIEKAVGLLVVEPDAAFSGLAQVSTLRQVLVPGIRRG